MPSLALLLLVGCKPLVVPPCSETSETACFKGVFRSLLGAPIEGMQICAPELAEVDCTETDANGGWRLLRIGSPLRAQRPSGKCATKRSAWRLRRRAV